MVSDQNAFHLCYQLTVESEFQAGHADELECGMTALEWRCGPNDDRAKVEKRFNGWNVVSLLPQFGKAVK